MSTTSTTSPRVEVSAPSRPRAAVGATIAVVINTGIWIAGRAADVSFLVESPVGDLRVGLLEVVLGTATGFAVGFCLLTWAARRSHALVRAVLVAAVTVAVLSTLGPLTTAHETSSGALLAAMHLVTGAAFMAALSGARGRSGR
jgi:hypothetical protein